MIFKGLSHPEVIKYYGISYQSIEECIDQIKFYRKLERNNTGIFLAIETKGSEDFVGVGGFNNLSSLHQKAEIGFWLLPEFWQMGYMQEAVRKICDYAFHSLNLHRIEGFVESENLTCKKAIEKLGFTHEGCMKECEIKNGKRISLDIYAILNTESLQ
jgi:ribosomal-protein-alanine N-acetyltransferase